MLSTVAVYQRDLHDRVGRDVKLGIDHPVDVTSDSDKDQLPFGDIGTQGEGDVWHVGGRATLTALRLGLRGC